MKLTFLGAAGTVTGSKFLLETQGSRTLIDCGLFQGKKEWRLRNWDAFPVDPASISRIILTHAHIDHSGYIRRLIQAGFRGEVYCTSGTLDLCSILLPDSGYLQEEDARRANKYGYSKHRPALPLYTEQEAEAALRAFKPVDFGHTLELSHGLRFTFHVAGHILGAAWVHIEAEGKSLLFSGDLGRLHDPVMRPPEPPPAQVDYLFVESTYGDRLHPDEDPEETLGTVIRQTATEGGKVVIPAFAVGRTQSLLYHLHRLQQRKEIPPLPIYLDSPMAIDATSIFCKHGNSHKLDDTLCGDVCHTAHYVRTVEESKALNHLAMPSVVLSASGMATGGRVLHHLKQTLGDPHNTVLFAGFQAPGTRGDALVNGAHEVKIHGKEYSVRAKIQNIDSLSAHADYEEILTWLSAVHDAPRKVFLTHGEPDSALALKERLINKRGWKVHIPEYEEEVQL